MFAAVDESDAAHARSLAVLQRADLQLVVPALVVAEVSYLVGDRLGSAAEAGFLRGLAAVEVEAPEPEDWARIAELVEQYADFPLGGTDASVVTLAERLEAEILVTLDHRHFGAIRPRHRPAFDLLPA